MVNLGSCKVAITRVVVSPDRGKRNGTWMTSRRVLSPELARDNEDVCLDYKSTTSGGSISVERVHTSGVTRVS